AFVVSACPTTTVPSAEVPRPESVPAIACIPPAAVHRYASVTAVSPACPMITLPPAEASFALLLGPAGTPASYWIPVAAVQRNGVRPAADSLSPTTTVPSPDTALATLRVAPPGSSPSPSKDCARRAGARATREARAGTNKRVIAGKGCGVDMWSAGASPPFPRFRAGMGPAPDIFSARSGGGRHGTSIAPVDPHRALPYHPA